MTITKQTLKDLIANGKTEQAIEQLLKINPQLDKDLQQDILIQSSKFKTYQKETRQETSSKEELQITLSKINHALLQIIQQLPDKQLIIDQKATNKILKWVLAIAVGIILVVVAELSGYNLRDRLFTIKPTIALQDTLQKTTDTGIQKPTNPEITDKKIKSTQTEKTKSKTPVTVINTNTFTFSGVVKDDTGFIKNAYIKIGNQSVYTNEKGEFEIQLQSDAEVRLEATLSGYESYSTRTIPRDDIIIALKKLNQ